MYLLRLTDRDPCLVNLYVPELLPNERDPLPSNNVEERV